MKTSTIHRLTPLLALTLTVLLSACNDLTGIDPNESLAPEVSTAQRTVQINDEPVAREIQPEFAPQDETPARKPHPLKTQYGERIVNKNRVAFSAAVVAESGRAVTLRIAVEAQDGNRYSVLRQVEGEAPRLALYFTGSSLPMITETLAKETSERSVAYWVEDDGGAEMTDRIRFAMPARAQP
jgi:hypothetical protein